VHFDTDHVELEYTRVRYAGFPRRVMQLNGKRRWIWLEDYFQDIEVVATIDISESGYPFPSQRRRVVVNWVTT
jgi:hypothetical protein